MFFRGSRVSQPQAAGTDVFNHKGYTGLSVLLEDDAATVTVKVGVSEEGPFPITITMEGDAELRYPASDQMNILYNAPFVEITVSDGTWSVFQRA